MKYKEFTVEIASFVCDKLGWEHGSTMSIMAEDEHRARYLLLLSLEQKLKDKENETQCKCFCKKVKYE